MSLINRPEIRYQKVTKRGPPHPTSSDSFLEKSMISSVGFEKFE